MGKCIVTKKECQKRLDERKGFVCPRCGGQLEIAKMGLGHDHFSYEMICRYCSVTNRGIEKEYYEMARELVLQGGMSMRKDIYEYNYRDSAENYEYYLCEQTEPLAYQIKKIDKFLADYRNKNMDIGRTKVFV